MIGSLQLLKRLDIRPFDHDASLHEDLENAAVRYLELTLERGSGTWAQLGRNRHHSSPIAQRFEKMVGLQGGKWWHLMILIEFDIGFWMTKWFPNFETTWLHLNAISAAAVCSNEWPCSIFFPYFHFYSISVSHVCQLLRSTELSKHDMSNVFPSLNILKQ